MDPQTKYDRLRRAWPHLRCALIGAHIVAVIALSLPTPGRLLNRRSWKSENTQEDLARWADRLSWLGYDSEDELEADLWELAQDYVRWRQKFIRPFDRYAEYAGTRQGWTMFASPQKRPGELHIEILVSDEWVPIFRPHSEYDFWGDKFRHNRFRKLLGRIPRTRSLPTYNQLTRFLAQQAARAFPDATQVWLRLYRYKLLPPDAIRAGERPQGRYTQQRLFDAEPLR